MVTRLTQITHKLIIQTFTCTVHTMIFTYFTKLKALKHIMTSLTKQNHKVSRHWGKSTSLLKSINARFAIRRKIRGKYLWDMKFNKVKGRKDKVEWKILCGMLLSTIQFRISTSMQKKDSKKVSPERFNPDCQFVRHLFVKDLFNILKKKLYKIKAWCISFIQSKNKYLNWDLQINKWSVLYFLSQNIW